MVVTRLIPRVAFLSTRVLTHLGGRPNPPSIQRVKPQMDPTGRLRTLYVIIGVPLGRDSDNDSGNVLVSCDWSTCTTYSPRWAANRQLRPNDMELQRNL